MEIVLKWVLILFAVYAIGYVILAILEYNMAKGHFDKMLVAVGVKNEDTITYTYQEIFQLSLFSWLGVVGFVILTFVYLVNCILHCGTKHENPWWEKSITPKTRMKEDEKSYFFQTRKDISIRN
jgi:hypothetical protein